MDITIQTVQADGSLHQVYKASGGEWGGTKVDEAFEEYLVSLVKYEAMDRFKKEHRDCYLDIFREFEVKKRTITPDLDGKVTFKIPISLNDIYQDIHGASMKDSISSEMKKSGKLSWVGDKLRMDASVAKQFFSTTCDAIADHLDAIFKQPEARDAEIILMVGGFSESSMLQWHIKKRFGNSRNIIIPPESGLSVLKGAVLYGFDTQIISERVMPETYGVQISGTFRNGIDPEDAKCTIKGTLYCDDRFSRHVEIGESVPLMTATKEMKYYPIEENQTQLTFKVYTTEESDPTYCEHDTCRYRGKMEVDIPTAGTKTDKEVRVSLLFGGTELVVKAVVTKTGEETKATIDCL